MVASDSTLEPIYFLKRWSIILALVGTAISILFWEPRIILGFLIGALIAVGNLYIIEGIIIRAFGSDKKKKTRYFLLTSSKYLVIIATLIIGIEVLDVNLVALLAGLTVFVGSILLLTIRLIIAALKV